MLSLAKNGFAFTCANECADAPCVRVVSDHGRVGGYCKSCGADRRGRTARTAEKRLALGGPPRRTIVAARCSDVIGSRLRSVVAMLPRPWKSLLLVPMPRN